MEKSVHLWMYPSRVHLLSEASHGESRLWWPALIHGKVSMVSPIHVDGCILAMTIQWCTHHGFIYLQRLATDRAGCDDLHWSMGRYQWSVPSKEMQSIFFRYMKTTQMIRGNNYTWKPRQIHVLSYDTLKW